jgi:hypothetical protein
VSALNLSDHVLTKIPCELSCDVPEGVILAPVPPSRHAWSDVLVCPNEGCGRTFLVLKVEEDARLPGHPDRRASSSES